MRLELRNDGCLWSRKDYHGGYTSIDPNAIHTGGRMHMHVLDHDSVRIGLFDVGKLSGEPTRRCGMVFHADGSYGL